MFLECYQQIPEKLNRETKHHEAKILLLKSIQTFKILMKDLQFLKSFWFSFCAYLEEQK